VAVIWLSGAIRAELAGRTDAGWMLTPMMGNRPDLNATWWAADTGCFTQPARHDDAAYLAWLVDRRACAHRCLFATTPDVVGDAAATWRRSRPMLAVIRALGYPAALVAQNGIHDRPVPWDAFDVLFVGGDDAFKLRDERTWALVAEAKRHGKWCHMGRVNSHTRYDTARAGGYDSADGTFLAFGPDANLRHLERWLARQQAVLPLALTRSDGAS
jgi:hypothetical protein